MGECSYTGAFVWHNQADNNIDLLAVRRLEYSQLIQLQAGHEVAMVKGLALAEFARSI